MIALSDEGFYAKDGDSPNLKFCHCGTRNIRMLVETVLSIFTQVCHLKKMLHQQGVYLQAPLTFTPAAFNVLV